MHSALHVSEAPQGARRPLGGSGGRDKVQVREAASPIWLRFLGDEREKEGLCPLTVQRFQTGVPPIPQHHQGKKLRHRSETG